MNKAVLLCALFALSTVACRQQTVEDSGSNLNADPMDGSLAFPADFNFVDLNQQPTDAEFLRPRTTLFVFTNANYEENLKEDAGRFYEFFKRNDVHFATVIVYEPTTFFEMRAPDSTAASRANNAIGEMAKAAEIPIQNFTPKVRFYRDIKNVVKSKISSSTVKVSDYSFMIVKNGRAVYADTPEKAQHTLERLMPPSVAAK